MKTGRTVTVMLAVVSENMIEFGSGGMRRGTSRGI
jgi:hypothetical protein